MSVRATEKVGKGDTYQLYARLEVTMMIRVPLVFLGKDGLTKPSSTTQTVEEEPEW